MHNNNTAHIKTIPKLISCLHGSLFLSIYSVLLVEQKLYVAYPAGRIRNSLLQAYIFTCRICVSVCVCTQNKQFFTKRKKNKRKKWRNEMFVVVIVTVNEYRTYKHSSSSIGHWSFSASTTRRLAKQLAKQSRVLYDVVVAVAVVVVVVVVIIIVVIIQPFSDVSVTVICVDYKREQQQT